MKFGCFIGVPNCRLYCWYWASIKVSQAKYLLVSFPRVDRRCIAQLQDPCDGILPQIFVRKEDNLLLCRSASLMGRLYAKRDQRIHIGLYIRLGLCTSITCVSVCIHIICIHTI